MTYSFRTNGNFIDFVHTDNTSLQVESVLRSLHNTSRAVSWSYSDDENRINFKVDDLDIRDFLISEIDFDGTAMNSQDDFETGITAMFPGLAGGSEVATYQIKTILTDDQIKALPITPVELVPAPGAGSILIYHKAVFNRPVSNVDYTGIGEDDGIDIKYDAGFSVSGGFWNDSNAGVVQLTTLLTNADLYGQYITTQFPVGVLNNGYTDPTIISTTDASAVNKAIVLSGEGDSSWTGGDADNSLEVTVFYSIVDL